jgi:hypothetical protein
MTQWKREYGRVEEVPRRSTLHDALDFNGNDNIRDKMMERAINR